MKFPRPRREKPSGEPQASHDKIEKKLKDSATVESKGAKDLSSQIPEWFLENCSQTVEELTGFEIPLNIREKPATDEKAEKEPDGPTRDVYEVLTVVYEPLLGLLTSRLGGETQTQELGPKAPKVFSKDAVFLRFPGKHGRKGGIPFLTAIIQQFARDAKADLITLGLDDLDDLVQDLAVSDEKRESENDPPTKATKKSEDIKGKKDTPATESPKPPQYSALLSSTTIKRSRNSLESTRPGTTPLVIHIPRVHALFHNHKQYYLEEISKAMKIEDKNIMLVLTTDQASDTRSQSPWFYPDYDEYDRYDRYDRYDEVNSYDDDSYFEPADGNFLGCLKGFARLFKRREILDEDGSDFHRPRRHGRHDFSQEAQLRDTLDTALEMQVICMAPIQSRAQRVLLETNRKLEKSFERSNIRLLQRSIRHKSPKNCQFPMVQPHAKWDFLDETPAKKKLAKALLDETEVNNLVDIISRDLGEEHIKQTIIRMGRREEALDLWRDSKEDERRETKWSAFPTRTQSVIKKIEDDEEGDFEWERRLLPLLINTDEIEEGWGNIALDPESKKAITQITSPPETNIQAYGVLKHSRIGGALLYGGPGTGKTHLARILARESKAVMVSASAAELVNMYIGESEKAIKALFNLGRMLAPCTIFIDEADALFRHRSSENSEWQRSQINQLLLEMDGLKKSKNPPFVLLATNYPSEIDHAVLRRVPSRIHLGLPSQDARVQIWKICLRDETLDPDVDLNYLASKSKGYSGSDIQTVCVQAALMCDEFIEGEGEGEGKEKKRLLKKAHFEKAFQRSPPTVSQRALDEIKAFAKEFDPQALETISKENIEGIGGLSGVQYMYM